MFLDFFCHHPSRFYGVLDGPSGPPLKKIKDGHHGPKMAVGGCVTLQTLLGANKYSYILLHTLSYPYIPIITHNRSCYSSIWCYKFAKYTYNICSSK